jgi:SAM-dependent methyltransferase
MPKPAALSLAAFDAQVRPCPLCGGTSFEALARHDRNLLGVVTVGCRGCGLVQTNPRPSAQGLSDFYRDHYRLYYQGTATPNQQYITKLNKDVRLARTARHLIDTLALREDATVLDFGCGEGSMFAALRQAGLTGAFFGVEPNASFGEFASRYGNATVSNVIRGRKQVDLVIVNHVLEHLDDPLGTLRELALLIKPAGHLYIDVPDAEEYDKIFDLHIAHIYHFTEQTLKSLVEKAGYTVLALEKHAPHFHPKSVRLVARPGRPADAAWSAPDAAAAARAWDAVRCAGRFRNTLRLRVRQLPLARRTYRLVRKLVGRAAPG